MGRAPLISVVTVVKDAEAAFARTAAAMGAEAEAGAGADIEWIVKSCGPLPGPERAAARAALPRVTIIETADGGIYDGMNQGLAAARGAYVFFLNAGDSFFAPGTLARVADTLRRAAPALLYGPYEIDGAPMGYPPRLTRFYFLRNAICHQAYFIRTDLVRTAGGFDTSYPVLADHELLLRLMGPVLAGHLRTDFPLTRLPPMGFSARQSEQKRRDRARMTAMHFPWARTPGLRLAHLATLSPLRQALMRFRPYARARGWVLRRVLGYR